ncbi:MAG: tagaturonate reductase [bacterium]
MRNYPKLNKAFLSQPQPATANIDLPKVETFDLPEKILQFGAGGFLRAFADVFVDQANRRGRFNGRIVVVQSTSSRRWAGLNDQDGLYTVCVQGVQQGKPVQEVILSSAISRAIVAQESWRQVLECAEQPEIEIIISNTTEVGIRHDPEDRLHFTPPRSFPGKLTAVLYHRFKTFSGAEDRGLLILPCELITDNGATLREIVLRLADQWRLEQEFVAWLESANRFCNTLVDRIVPGKPAAEQLGALYEELGYQDDLLLTAEIYSLWAIEGDAAVRKRLSFCDANPAILIAPDITAYRERKLRLLNGTHTVSVPLAWLVGNRYVIDMMTHPLTSEWVESVMRQEIGRTLDMGKRVVADYIDSVLDRFRNPYLRHALLDITFESTSKLRLRVVPTIEKYYEKFGEAPLQICFGFAAYLLFMRAIAEDNDSFSGQRGDEIYPINDSQAAYFYHKWREVDAQRRESIHAFVESICSNVTLWGSDLAHLPGFVEVVANNLNEMISEGVERALRQKR